MKPLSETISSDPELLQLLIGFARKYVWWRTPEVTVSRPEYVVSRVMDIGDYGDVQQLAKHVSEECLREILRNAEIGQFNERSWTYWHYRLGLPASEEVPPMPIRRLA